MHTVTLQALSEVVPAIASKKVGKGGYMVLRPDSGDPTEAVLMVRRPALTNCITPCAGTATALHTGLRDLLCVISLCLVHVHCRHLWRPSVCLALM